MNKSAIIAILGLILLVGSSMTQVSARPNGISNVQSGCSCHSGSATEEVVVTLDGVPDNYTAGETLTLTITITFGQVTGSVNHGGFNLVVSAGTLAPFDNTSQLMDEELTHTELPGDQHGNLTGWKFNWTAPAYITTNITFIAHGMAANGDGSANSDDKWKKVVATIAKDTDGDGVTDKSDAFPNDGNETVDSDGDGVGDNGDAFPNDRNETVDSDGDGVGDNGDEFPHESSQWVDDDGDGLGDNTNGTDGDPYPDDFDNDGVIDSEDAFPTDANETMDTDGDGLGDEADEDDDGDGILDEAEIREGSDPKDPNSLPPEPFELTLPIFGISLSAWDLMGVITGLCLLVFVGGATLTREKRFEDYMEKIESTASHSELDDISKRLEQLQLFRLLGVRHVLRLEQRIMEIQDTMLMMDDGILDNISNPSSNSEILPIESSEVINDEQEWAEWPENNGPK